MEIHFLYASLSSISYKLMNFENKILKTVENGTKMEI